MSTDQALLAFVTVVSTLTHTGQVFAVEVGLFVMLIAFAISFRRK